MHGSVCSALKASKVLRCLIRNNVHHRCMAHPSTHHRPLPDPSVAQGRQSPLPRCKPIWNRKYNNPSVKVAMQVGTRRIPSSTNLTQIQSHLSPCYCESKRIRQLSSNSGELVHLTLSISMLSLTRIQFFTPSVVQPQNPISQPTLPSSFVPFFFPPFPFFFFTFAWLCAPAISFRMVGQITVSHRWDEEEGKEKKAFSANLVFFCNCAANDAYLPACLLLS